MIPVLVGGGQLSPHRRRSQMISQPLTRKDGMSVTSPRFSADMDRLIVSIEEDLHRNDCMTSELTPDALFIQRLGMEEGPVHVRGRKGARQGGARQSQHARTLRRRGLVPRI